MEDIKGSKTYDNLLIAFAGESQARNRYDFYAAKAREEGYIQIAEIFEKTASNEKEHAEIWYRHMAGIDGTKENLIAAAEGEHYEWSEMYAEMAKTAREEGFAEIGRQMEQIAEIEKHHEDRYLKLKENIEKQRVFEREEKVIWICDNCGFQTESESAPQICPVCSHSRGYFKIKEKNY